MAKIEAYRCDRCGEFASAGDIAGIDLTHDMFDTFKSYPYVHGPVAMTKCKLHVCFHCRWTVQQQTIALEGKKPPAVDSDQYRAWIARFHELDYLLRSSIVTASTRPNFDRDLDAKRKVKKY